MVKVEVLSRDGERMWAGELSTVPRPDDYVEIWEDLCSFVVNRVEHLIYENRVTVVLNERATPEMLEAAKEAE